MPRRPEQPSFARRTGALLFKTEDELKKIVAESSSVDASAVEEVAATGRWHVFCATTVKKAFFGLVKSKKQEIRVVDEEGVIRLQKNDAKVLTFTKDELGGSFSEFVDSMTLYTDAGATLPKTYLFLRPEDERPLGCPQQGTAHGSG